MGTMDALKQMSEQEILALSGEQVRRMIDLICLENGIPLLPVLPEQPVKPECEPDMTLYKVGAFGYASASAAEEVLKAMKSHPVYDDIYESFGRVKNKYGSYDDAVTKVVARRLSETDYSFPKFVTKDVFSESLWVKVKHDFEAYGMLKGRYDEAKQLYDHVLEQRKETEASVWEIVQEAHSREHGRNNHRREFEPYLAIANGDRKTALAFYSNSHKGFAEEYPELVAEFSAEAAQGGTD